jgi:hypothetical protein
VEWPLSSNPDDSTAVTYVANIGHTTCFTGSDLNLINELKGAYYGEETLGSDGAS